MTTHKVHVNLSDGVVSTDQDGAVTLDGSNDLEIEIGSGFDSGAKVTAMTLYEWVASAANGQGPLVGTWERANPQSQPTPVLSITAGTHHINVVDVDETADAAFCYTATVTSNDQPYTTPDPELLVKKKKVG